MTQSPYEDALEDDLTPILRVSRDIASGARLLTRNDARYLVDLYYEVQEQRIRADAQARQAELDDDTPNPVIFLTGQWNQFETNTKKVLQAYALNHPVGRWSMEVPGIGPVIAAGLLAHIDVEHGGVYDPATGTRGPVNSVGHIWRFAGLDPTVEWGKGQKRPWNAKLKVLCWKIGESFVKVQNRENDIYGHVYAERKALEIQRNERGDFAAQARISLDTRNYGADTIARSYYEKGQLPPARIHARAKRYAVKLFLSHWHHVAYEVAFHREPPMPYIIEHGGHTDFVAPPFWPMNDE